MIEHRQYPNHTADQTSEDGKARTSTILAGALIGAGVLGFAIYRAVGDEEVAAPAQIIPEDHQISLPSKEELTLPQRETVTPPTLSVANTVPRESGPTPAKKHTVQINGENFTEEWDGDLRRLWRADGTLYDECAEVKGKPYGTETTWYPNGQISNIGNWENGLRIGTWMSYSDKGVITSQGGYHDGFRDGVWETYYPTGQKESSGSYKAVPADHTQQQQGQWFFWSPDGSLDQKRSGYYENGNKIHD